MRIRTAGAVLLVAGATVAGCGGGGGGGEALESDYADGTEEAAVVKTVSDFNIAFANKDGEKACSYLTSGGQKNMENAVGDLPPDKSCEDLVSSRLEHGRIEGGGINTGDMWNSLWLDVGDDGNHFLNSHDLDEAIVVKVNGQVARLTAPGRNGLTYLLTEHDGEWLIEAVGDENFNGE
ncbi:MAG: hypothetical protein KDB54_11950 [Solirubrobacterales bacterium]|nr:hypothetical protein [Solirubrobacterales bacterium]MCB0861353.1 hypothetical protein [Solirubrobacterales bacterium]HRV59062.1 hypothetical protein [Solirubrobacterales bacterium]